MLPDDALHFLESSTGHSASEILILPLKEEASARRYYKVTVPDQISYALCLDTPFPKNHNDFLIIQKQLLLHGIPVPKIHSFDEKKGFILQSFAGQKDLADIKSIDFEISKRLLADSIEILGSLQNLSLLEPVSTRFFDYDKLFWEIEFLENWLKEFSSFLSIDYYFPFELKMFFSEVCSSLDKLKPAVFCHRDFHSRNIMVHDSKITLIDFQDARSGNIYYDLSSLLYDPYAMWSPEIRSQSIESFLKVSNNSDCFKIGEYYLQALQRLSKAIGSYCFLITGKNRKDYLQPIKSAFHLLKELSQEAMFPDSIYLFASHYSRI